MKLEVPKACLPAISLRWKVVAVFIIVHLCINGRTFPPSSNIHELGISYILEFQSMIMVLSVLLHREIQYSELLTPRDGKDLQVRKVVYLEGNL